MGLDHYYDEKAGVWVTSGYCFRREYATEAEMDEHAQDDLEDYFEQRRNFGAFMMAFASLRKENRNAIDY